jgi:hypothetical protein
MLYDLVQLVSDKAIISTIFDENATLKALLQLVLCIAVFWSVFFFFFGLIIGPLVRGTRWLQAAGSRGMLLIVCNNVVFCCSN